MYGTKKSHYTFPCGGDMAAAATSGLAAAQAAAVLATDRTAPGLEAA